MDQTERACAVQWSPRSGATAGPRPKFDFCLMRCAPPTRLRSAFPPQAKVGSRPIADVRLPPRRTKSHWRFPGPRNALAPATPRRPSRRHGMSAESLMEHPREGELRPLTVAIHASRLAGRRPARRLGSVRGGSAAMPSVEPIRNTSAFHPQATVRSRPKADIGKVSVR